MPAFDPRPLHGAYFSLPRPTQDEPPAFRQPDASGISCREALFRPFVDFIWPDPLSGIFNPARPDPPVAFNEPIESDEPQLLASRPEVLRLRLLA